MTPVFPNSAQIDAPERAVQRGGRWQRRALQVRYGILPHPGHGPVLIDTGYGPELFTAPGRGAALRLYARVLGPKLLSDGAPEAALSRLGFAPDDVRTIIVTHFHADHICALHRFPAARVIAPAGALATIRARGRIANLRHGIFEELIPAKLEARMTGVESLPTLSSPLGLGTGHDLLGDGSLLAVDLPGHAQGHFGVVFPRLDPPLLYAVDTQWVSPALETGRAPGLPLTAIVEDATAMADSTARVRAFAQAGGQVQLCHDPAPGPFDA